jgi:putative endonuclease
VETPYYVYMLASGRNGTLYVSVTDDLAQRVWELKADSGFLKRYGVHSLVWYEAHSDLDEAITRAKRLKGWDRAWKIRLIEERNSDWSDLFKSVSA